MEAFTEMESKELGIPLKLLNEWGKLMQEVWSYCISLRLPELKNEENVIRFKGSFEIVANFINYKYIEVEVRTRDEKKVFVNILYTGHSKSVLRIIGVILEDLLF